jgi:hypothetical protein
VEKNVVQFRHLIYVAVLAVVAITSRPDDMVQANEPGWAKTIVPTGEERAQVKATPIEMRPYRPLHIYGNTVRRRYYHGTAVPLPRELTPAARK